MDVVEVQANMSSPTALIPKSEDNDNDDSTLEIHGSLPHKRRRRLTSAVWLDFKKVKKSGADFAMCMHCSKLFVGSSTSGTTHLKKHLERCPKKLNDEIGEQFMPFGKRRKDKSVTLRNMKFDQERSRVDLARMVLVHNYPFSIVEQVGFRTLVGNLQPLFKLITSDVVEADCQVTYEKEKERLVGILGGLPGRISVTANMWDSLPSTKYMCLTAHYIDESWVLQKKILNFAMVEPPHTGETFSDVIMSCVMDWKIDHKLFGITLDNTSINDNVVSRMRDRLFQKRMLMSDGQLFHIRCIAHILSLIVQDGLETISEIIQKIRESIRYLKCSHEFYQIAHEVGIQSERSLCLDVPTDWSSSYLMLEIALEYKEAFSRSEVCKSEYAREISDQEWEMVSDITQLLKVFHELGLVLSSAKNPTSNIYFPVVCSIKLRLNEWCSDSDSFMRRVALKMKERFDKYWDICNLILAVAVILDPRFKMKLIEFYYPQIYGDTFADRVKDVHNSISNLYNAYAARSSSLASSHTWGVRPEDNGGSCVDLSQNDAGDSKDILKGFDEFLHGNSVNQRTKSDLDLYLEEPVFPRNLEFDILNWWKLNSPKYPVLSRMARDVLSVPALSSLPESTFSIEGRVLDAYRSSLSPYTLQALICAQDWLRDDIEGALLTGQSSSSLVTTSTSLPK